ncbi:MAG: SDR family NAD(P)-dependent oxidoreductase [Beutenbergiaceae bacterium]
MGDNSSEIYRGHFNGKRVLVTGGASGIGLGIATAFAENGASVLMIDRDPRVAESADGLKAQGYDAIGIEGDVTSEADVAKAIATAEESWGQLDVVINNAGVTTISTLEDLPLSDWQKIMDVNTTAQFIVIKAATPLLRKSESGVILNAASGQARKGFIFTPHYAASKFGVVGLTQSLAQELVKDNIRVNSYCPGIVATDMWDYNDREWGRLLGDYKPGELIAEWIDGIPMKRPAAPADVANLLLFLASDAGNYITGQAINIDGGMFMN